MATELFPNAAPAAEPTTDDGKVLDLSSKIDKASCYAFNEAVHGSWANLLMGDSRLGCQSDADEQLIVHIAFQEFVKIKYLQLQAFNDNADPEKNPSQIHLYVNRENLGFEDAADVDPTQTLHLTSEDLKDRPIPLKYVKYQRVKSLTLFIEDNQGGEVSALGGLKIFGRPVQSTNMAEFQKKPEG